MLAENTINHAVSGGDLMSALTNVEQLLRGKGIEKALHHLILLRASQINKCAFCVDMHTREAREDGETDQRLDHLIVWRQMDEYTPRERAALAWVEALTELKPEADFSSLRTTLKELFSDEEISTITTIVAMINLWNRVQISNH